MNYSVGFGKRQIVTVEQLNVTDGEAEKKETGEEEKISQQVFSVPCD